MNGMNDVFKSLAERMGLPRFFAGTTLLFNNLFLTILAVVLLIALLLVIFLVPGKKKANAEEKKEMPSIDASASVVKSMEESLEEPPAPVTEEAPVESAESAAPEQALVEEVAEEPIEEVAPAEEVEESAQESKPGENAPQEVIEEPAEAPVEEVQEDLPIEESADEAIAEEEISAEEEVVEEPVAEEAADPTESEEEAAEAPDEEAAAESEEEPASLKKSEAKEEKAAPKNGGKYEIVKRHGGYYFLLKANNGQLLLESSSYTSVQGVKSAIETFKNAVEVGTFSIDEDKNGNFKFVLRASARSQMLYHGESYSSRQSAENAIGSVKNFAFKAVIKRTEENDEEDDADSTKIVETKPLGKDDHKLGGKYEIIERSGSFYFLLKANNGQLLLESPAFTTEQGAKNGIDSFKKAANDGIFIVDTEKNGSFRFILRASARSQMRYLGESYSTRQSAENSVHSVRAFAQKAVLK